MLAAAITTPAVTQLIDIKVFIILLRVMGSLPEIRKHRRLGCYDDRTA
jgi:hypothetical protein